MLLPNSQTEAAKAGKSEVTTDSPGVSDQEWQTLYRVLGGHIFFQTLAAAVQLDLFGLLSKRGALTRKEIAESLGIEQQPRGFCCWAVRPYS